MGGGWWVGVIVLGGGTRTKERWTACGGGIYRSTNPDWRKSFIATFPRAGCALRTASKMGFGIPKLFSLQSPLHLNQTAAWTSPTSNELRVRSPRYSRNIASSSTRAPFRSKPGKRWPRLSEDITRQALILMWLAIRNFSGKDARSRP